VLRLDALLGKLLGNLLENLWGAQIRYRGKCRSLASPNMCKDELMPAAASGVRLVVVHRPGLWKIPPGDRPNFYQAVDPEWARRALPMRFRSLIEEFLTASNS
jgi:hypothetical protein